jgi:hypothetical protein
LHRRKLFHRETDLFPQDAVLEILDHSMLRVPE